MSTDAADGPLDDAVVGLLATVVIRVRGGDQPGEILVRVRGGAETLIAYADTCIERNSQVLIITSRGHRSVDVIPSQE